MSTTQRIDALRQWISDHSSDCDPATVAYIVPTADPHNDEYIPPHWMCREWITGFTGSAGTAVITLSAAALWTDSRYWLQAADQLADTPVTLMREGEADCPSLERWLKEQGVKCIAGPSDMLSLSLVSNLQGEGFRYVTLPDAFDDIWADRPALPAAPITVWSETYAGRTASDKLSALADKLDAESTETDAAYLINDLADIAWLLNLRGADIDYNPVFVAYLIYSKESHSRKFTLYTHVESLTPEAAEALRIAKVDVQPYAEALAFVSTHPTHIDRNMATMSLATGAPHSFFSPVERWRAVKNQAEAEGMRTAMLRDGIAMVKFLRWLDEEMQAGHEVTELSIDEKLTALRAEQPGFRSLSFATIAAHGAHGAIVHYEADRHTSVRLPQHGLLLLDSGGQYDCGTTDITRTIAVGGLTAEERHVYTLVMKGHLRLESLHFPEGTTGLQLDLAARQDMWAAGYDFGHGTGHGVGAGLCVHEGPHQIRKDLRACTLIPFAAGMTITDEPGIYVEGRFGVRIENTLLCVPSRTTAFGHFLKFEVLTLCPYDLRALDRSLLTLDEIEQINAYHLAVRRAIMPHLTDDADKIWLARATAAIESES